MQSFAGFNFNSNCRKAYHLAAGLRFSEARSILAVEKISDPGNAIPYYIDNYIDFLTIAISQESGNYQTLSSDKSTNLEKISAAGKKSPYSKYCVAQIHLQWAILKIFISGSETGLWEGIGAALDINKVNNLIESNTREYPSFVPDKLCLAVLHALSGSITSEYAWAKYIIPFNGTISQSISELKEVLDYSLKNENYSFLTEDALLYLTFIELNLSPNKREALELMKYYNDTSLKETISSSPLLTYAKASIYMKNGLTDSAISIFSKPPSGHPYFPFYLLDFAYGKALINKLDDKSSLYFFKYLLNYKGYQLVKSSYQQIAWMYLMEGNPVKYREYMNKCLSSGSLNNEADRMANNEAKSGRYPDIVLLKARLLCDGGYYAKALEILKDFTKPVKTRNKRDTIEYFYRLGRIYHEWGKQPQAVQNYEKCMTASIGTTYYFAMNAAYQLGSLFEVQKDYKRARMFYEKCLDMDADEYKKGIRQKAKIALKRIDKK